MSQANGTALVFNDLPDQRFGMASINHRQADQTIAIPKPLGAQRHIRLVLVPVEQRILDQRCVQGQRLDTFIVQPTPKTPLTTLRLPRSPRDESAPFP
jgi:hypothetical protein